MLLLASAVPASMRASTTAPSNGGNPPAPTPAPYIEAPQPTITTVTSTFNSPYGSGPYWGSGGFYGPHYGGFYNTTVISSYPPRRYFFPPRPPALGEPYLRNRTKAASLVRSTIPLTLSEYVNEPFYAPLSPLLFEEDVSRKRQRTLDDYLATKRALVQELKAKLASVAHLAPAAREAALAEFASQQTPRIVELEATAEHIRQDLTTWKLFSETTNWNEGRDWRLGDDTRWESTLDEAKLMRGAAYFQDGLSPAQRRLLREYAMKLDDSASGPAGEVSLDTRGPYFYFSPATSRIRLPANLPVQLRVKIATYTDEKSRLEKEIRDVLYHEDRRWFDWHRREALEKLAQEQAPRIAALEPLAEEIRRELAPLPNPARPASLSQTLPADLANRISRFMDEKAAFEKTMVTRLDALKREFRTSRVEFVKMGEGVGIQLVGNRRLGSDDRARLERAATELAPFNNAQITEFVRLAQEKEAIREGLVQATGALAPMVSPRMVDLILHDYLSNVATQELWRRYRDYDVAVLEPGLSPEQRRLLYDAALIELDQQLPGYTY